MTGPVRIGVIGGGVIGLTVAHESARNGMPVTVYRDARPADTVSAIAAAIWFPFEAGPRERVAAWSNRSRRRFEELAQHPETGVGMLRGTIVHRSSGPPAWRTMLPEAQRTTVLPPGVAEAWEATIPVIEMPRYLNWLEAACEHLGVEFAEGRIRSVDEIHGDAVVVAGGLSSARLLDDPQPSFGIRGQVVRVANPGLDRWLLDLGDDGAPTYVIPRSEDVVLGGTAERAEDAVVDPAIEDAILTRARRLVPELRDAPVLSRAVGLRPGRAEVRLEPVPGHRLPVVACYGHGGAGVTTSWGCAAEAVDLVRDAVAVERVLREGAP